MAGSLSISGDQQLNPAVDYNFLRRKGIEKIQDLCGDNWTDYNSHDPGITLLEALCFGLTDLGYRASFDMKDILAGRQPGVEDWENIFYTADRILPCNPVTLTDYRKLVADIAGVRNGWVEMSEDYEVSLYLGKEKGGYRLSYDAGKGAAVLPLKGLYRVLVEFEEDVIRENREEDVLQKVGESLHRHRNLCEDFVVISAVEYELFTLEAEIKVSEGCDIELITAQIYKVIRDLFSPSVNFYTLEQMRQRGYNTEEIFEGPLLNHGFIDTAELEGSARSKEVQLSDIISRITDIDGVIAIEKLSIPKDAGATFPDFTEWLGRIKDQQKTPRLDTEHSQVIFIRNGDRHRNAAERKADPARVRGLLDFLLAGTRKVRLKGNQTNWELAAGEHMELENYYAFQRNLPRCYGMEEKFIEEKGDAAQQIHQLDAGKRGVLQLRGFLLLFEQILANYLSQLAHTRELFSFGGPSHQTYFTQIPEGVNDLEALFVNFPSYKKQADELLESIPVSLQRRNKVLDHLLSRFGEDLSSLNAVTSFKKQAAERQIRNKVSFLQDVVALSNYRGRGFNYTLPADAWDTDNVAGCKKRVCRLLGMPGYQRNYIAADTLYIEEVRHANDIIRYVVRLMEPSGREHVLLESVEYDSRAEAELTLDYILEHGMDEHLYYADARGEKIGYNLQQQTEEGDLEVVAYGHSRHGKEKGRIFGRVVEVLKDFSEEENFHLIEHILLRPRINGRGRAEEKHHSLIGKEQVALLPVPDGDIPAGDERGTASAEQAPYRFNMIQVKDPGKKEGWQVSLVNTGGDEIFSAPELFPFYRHLTRRVAHLRQLAADRTNYSIESIADGYFRLVILDGSQRIAEGKKKYNEEEKAMAEIDALVRFFSFDRHIQEQDKQEEAGSMAVLDPYSFHVTVVLPSWPARFRDPGFRHLLEKTLFLEMPAHIYPHVYWVRHQEMARFEEAYKLWLNEQCNATIPNTEILNNLLYALNELEKNKGA